MLGNLRYIQYTTIDHKLNTWAIEYIDEARASDPARKVGINACTNTCQKESFQIAAQKLIELIMALKELLFRILEQNAQVI